MDNIAISQADGWADEPEDEVYQEYLRFWEEHTKTGPYFTFAGWLQFVGRR